MVRDQRDLFPIPWLPSHIGMFGLGQADQLAEHGRVRRGAYPIEWVREVQRQQQDQLHRGGSWRRCRLMGHGEH